MDAAHSPTTAIGTIGGTVLTILVNIESHDVIKTIALAGIGAVVSFLVTIFLKWLAKHIKDVFSR
jgi:mannose/fructose/N-acetylgalactosamine-specific phosphotransferase system component IIC